MIPAGSRYVGAEVVGVTNAAGAVANWVGHRREFDPTRDLGPAPRSVPVRTAVPIDVLAMMEVGSEHDWWIIVDANPDVFNDFDTLLETMFDLPIGTSLIVPRREDVRIAR